MSQFWTLSSYFRLDRRNLSTILFTLAQLSPINQMDRTYLETIIGSIATILSCLQTGLVDISPTTANQPLISRQQNISLVKLTPQDSLLTIVKRGLPATISGKIWQFLAISRGSVGPSLVFFGIT